MDFGWEFLSICYGVVAGLLYTFVYWIEVVLGKIHNLFDKSLGHQPHQQQFHFQFHLFN